MNQLFLISSPDFLKKIEPYLLWESWMLPDVILLKIKSWKDGKAKLHNKKMEIKTENYNWPSTIYID